MRAWCSQAWQWIGLISLCVRPTEAREPPRDPALAVSVLSARPPAERVLSLEATARRLLADARPLVGGVVVIHAPSGRILVWEEYRRPGQAGHPLTQAITPAASLFKIVTTVALLERTPVTTATEVCINGGEHDIDRTHLNAPRQGTNVLCRPFGEALGFSRNAVFAQLATQHLLRQDLIEVAQRLGFNRALAFDTPATLGILDVPYNDLEFARTAVGFRGSKLSVLGAARLAYIVASGGRVLPIRLDPQPTLAASGPEASVVELAMEPSTAQRLRRMMEVTVHSGTSLEAFTAPGGGSYLGSIRAAGKTGTLRPGEGGSMASWFIGFAPSRAPELVVSVMLENSEVWRRKANHVARDVMRAYFHDRPNVTHPLLP